MTHRWLKTVALCVSLTLSVGLVIALAKQIDTLGERYRQLERRARAAHAGMYVPEVTVPTLAGDTVTLADPAERQLLFFLTTTCPYCRASLPGWIELAAGQAPRFETLDTGERVRVVGVVMDSVHLAEAYRDEHGLDFSLVVLQDRRYAGLFRVSQVPLTLVVDGPAGQVLHARVGQLTGPAAMDSIRMALVAPSPGAPRELPSPVSTQGDPEGGG